MWQQLPRAHGCRGQPKLHRDPSPPSNGARTAQQGGGIRLQSELVARLVQLEHSSGTFAWSMRFQAKFYTREQAYRMDKLTQQALAAGLKRNFGFRDVSTEAAAQAWIETVTREVKVIHGKVS